MRMEKTIFFLPVLLIAMLSNGQGRVGNNSAVIKNPMVEAIVKEAMENSQLETLAGTETELLISINLFHF